MSVKEYRVRDLDKVWFEYDKQNDILYINFGDSTEEADEEFLSENGDVAFRIKEGRIISIMIIGLSTKAGFTVL
ncbi:hypothetical protein TCELL_0572 [Thermogladius calderae 1633]|uniref:DUF2283 domain-containing protein n=1 Tax=Thermogladius calderae (strain DSM 22663 / VKM B-2946 / 1633) TaxID=1184251 RepID=I3TE09_THEC1|nr:DUF2283 domain-containing protein [Thermogladius calderae]AFK50997.1 hypothetical protein TCELL_0572 [Thermogladius calderae 1633]